MGMPFVGFYGNADVGSAIKDIKTIIEKIETNKFGAKDILKLHKADAELIEALLINAYED